MPRQVRYAARCALAALLGLALAMVGSPGCRAATQVTVEVRVAGLTCDQVKGVNIVVARTPGDAEDKLGSDQLSAQISKGDCGSDPHLLGTLVLTPSGSTGAIAVRARVRDDAAATCKRPDYKGCIVSRRAFAFVDHASVVLPMTLEISCADVPCDAVTSCRTGTCVSSDTQCSESGECVSGAEPGVLPDGGGPSVDGAGGDGTSPDGARADGAADADAAKEAGGDAEAGVPGNATNLCPGSVAGECIMGDVCCCTSSLCSCQQPPAACANHGFNCTGRKFCSSAFCCGSGSVGFEFGICMATCPGPILCATNGDCPSDMHCGSTVFFSNASGKMFECER